MATLGASLRWSGAVLVRGLRILRVLLVGALWASVATTLALWLWGGGAVGGDVVVILCGVALTLQNLFRVWPMRS